MRVYHNIPALFTYNALNSTNESLQKSINKLSTGLRINTAADDAAGLAISEKMRAQSRGLDMAVRNAQDGISMIQTAEGALNETQSILQRMRELSVQAANDTLTANDRQVIQSEIDQLKEEVDRIASTTQFNKKKLLDGTASVLWSSDKLETKAFVRGSLRQIDQFGQKTAAEGNFKISIDATPGQGQIQKSDIFKVKHENVMMNVSINTAKGVNDVEIDSLPAGNYKLTLEKAPAATVAGVASQVSYYG
ncbi:MAG TPA: flagellin, partial [Thermosynergistes sp.]|nr:flagellin [Thermosynergistes sp.]